MFEVPAVDRTAQIVGDTPDGAVEFGALGVVVVGSGHVFAPFSRVDSSRWAGKVDYTSGVWVKTPDTAFEPGNSSNANQPDWTAQSGLRKDRIFRNGQSAEFGGTTPSRLKLTNHEAECTLPSLVVNFVTEIKE